MNGVFHKVVIGSGIYCCSEENLDHTSRLKKIDFFKINTYHRFSTQENDCTSCMVNFVYFPGNLLSHPVS